MQDLRVQIDQIHDELFKLFEKRISITMKIWQNKVLNDSELIDTDREKFLIHMHDEKDLFKDNLELKVAYQNIIKNLIELNKKHLLSELNLADKAKNAK